MTATAPTHGTSDTAAGASTAPATPAPPAPSPFEATTLGPMRLRNRIIKAATFEARMPRGAVTDELIDYHVAVARGGAGLSTVAYCAVSMGGRVSKDTMVMTEALIPDLQRLTEAVHTEAVGGRHDPHRSA